MDAKFLLLGEGVFIVYIHTVDHEIFVIKYFHR